MKRVYRFVLSAIMAILMITLSVSLGSAESATPIYTADEQFTDRDLEQTANLSKRCITLSQPDRISPSPPPASMCSAARLPT